MSKRVLGYVVREGKVRGEGRYLGRWGRRHWQPTRKEGGVPGNLEETVFNTPDERHYAEENAKAYGGRVVAIVKKSACSTCAQWEAIGGDKAAVSVADATRAMLAQARAEGVAEGLERAAKECLEEGGECARRMHHAIRALISAPPSPSTRTESRGHVVEVRSENLPLYNYAANAESGITEACDECCSRHIRGFHEVEQMIVDLRAALAKGGK